MSLPFGRLQGMHNKANLSGEADPPCFFADDLVEMKRNIGIRLMSQTILTPTTGTIKSLTPLCRPRPRTHDGNFCRARALSVRREVQAVQIPPIHEIHRAINAEVHKAE
jgi:hypothetical protein